MEQTLERAVYFTPVVSTPEAPARLTVAEAAKMLQCTPLFLRLAIQKGVFDFGECLQQSGGRYTYYINRAKLEKYIRGE